MRTTPGNNNRDRETRLAGILGTARATGKAHGKRLLGEAPLNPLASSFLCAFSLNACIGSLKPANCCYCQAGGCSHCWVFNISEERSYQIPRARPLPCSHHDCRSPSALHRLTVLRSIPFWEDPYMVLKSPFSKGNRSLEANVCTNSRFAKEWKPHSMQSSRIPCGCVHHKN